MQKPQPQGWGFFSATCEVEVLRATWYYKVVQSCIVGLTCGCEALVTHPRALAGLGWHLPGRALAPGYSSGGGPG